MQAVLIYNGERSDPFIFHISFDISQLPFALGH
jgi:hypothetical protein